MIFSLTFNWVFCSKQFITDALMFVFSVQNCVKSVKFKLVLIFTGHGIKHWKCQWYSHTSSVLHPDNETFLPINCLWTYYLYTCSKSYIAYIIVPYFEGNIKNIWLAKGQEMDWHFDIATILALRFAGFTLR